LQRAIELETEHISAYSLIVEPGTKLAAKVNRGQLPNIDSDFHADCYELASELLESAGFGWYEVSNWAKGVQNESVHNKAYWQSRDWWGFGPGAHSHFAGTRWWNAKHPATYQDRLDRGISPAVGQERLTERQVLEERLLLELRTAAGIEAEVLSQLGVDKGAVASEIASGNLALLPERRLAVTRQGRLIADGIVLRLLGSE
jgi:oxygen-independent coproporphyrinogen-3 oxidase